jgi:acyl-CoA thioester hydrolase
MKIQTRWMDNDQFGHVNNVVYYSFFDTIVNTFLNNHSTLFQTNVIGIVVASKCQYKSSVTFPDVITCGLRVLKIGNSSITYGIGVFKDQVYAADGEFVHVMVQKDTMKPTAIPSDVLQSLNQLKTD